MVTYFAPARNSAVGSNRGWQKTPPWGPWGLLKAVGRLLKDSGKRLKDSGKKLKDSGKN